MEAGRDSRVVPRNLVESVEGTLANLAAVENQLVQFLPSCSIDVIDELPPVERARNLLLLAKITSTLFTVRLRCDGLHPDEHPLSTELERLRLYEDKVQKLVDLSQAPQKPSTVLNYQAASRFIEHSLPDLTPEQRNSLRESRKEETRRLQYVQRVGQKKRKHRSSHNKSIKDAATQFLEKAAREIMDGNVGGIKGPLKLEQSDDKDMSAAC